MKRRRAGVRVAVLGAPGPAARPSGSRRGRGFDRVDLWTFCGCHRRCLLLKKVSNTRRLSAYYLRTICVLGTVASDGPAHQHAARRRRRRRTGHLILYTVSRHDVRLSLPPRAPSSRVCTRFLLTRGSAPLPVRDRHGACSSLVHRSRPCPECCIDSQPLAGTRCPAREAGAV